MGGGLCLHPSNLQANELENKVKCRKQTHVAPFSELLKKQLLKGESGVEVARSSGDNLLVTRNVD